MCVCVCVCVHVCVCVWWRVEDFGNNYSLIQVPMTLERRRRKRRKKVRY